MTAKEAYDKCNDKINKELEPYFIKNPFYAYNYAVRMIKGRWIEAEQYIINNSELSFWYAQDIIQGKLPENMHNMMLLYADEHAKDYLKYINA